MNPTYLSIEVAHVMNRNLPFQIGCYFPVNIESLQYGYQFNHYQPIGTSIVERSPVYCFQTLHKPKWVKRYALTNYKLPWNEDNLISNDVYVLAIKSSWDLGSFRKHDVIISKLQLFGNPGKSRSVFVKLGLGFVCSHWAIALACIAKNARRCTLQFFVMYAIILCDVKYHSQWCS